MQKSILAIGLAAGLLAVSAGRAQDRLVGPEVLAPLSSLSEPSHDPVVDARGGDAMVAWKASFEGRSRIFAVRRVNKDWTYPYPVDSSLEGNCLDPVVRFVPGGGPALAWVREIGSEFTVEYSAPASLPREIARSSERLEAPSLSFDSEGQPTLAWTEGSGGRFHVTVARPDGSGDWTVRQVRTSPESYDVFPRVIGDTVFFYGLENTDFVLKGARLVDGAWRVFTPPVAEILPANRFPFLYGTPAVSEPGAVWMEPLTDGEAVFAWDPRFTAEAPILEMPGQAGARQLEPDAAGSPAMPAFAWREESEGDSDIVVLHQGVQTRLQGLAHARQPRIAADGEGGLHLVLISDRAEGGTGQVFWTYLPN